MTSIKNDGRCMRLDNSDKSKGRDDLEDLRFLIVKRMLNEFPELRRRIKEHLKEG